jgi:hypothetical protein
MHFFKRRGQHFKKNTTDTIERKDSNGHWQPPIRRQRNGANTRKTVESMRQPTLPHILLSDAPLPVLPSAKHRSQYPAYVNTISNTAIFKSSQPDATTKITQVEPIKLQDQSDRLEIYRHIISTIVEGPIKPMTESNNPYANSQYDRHLVWVPPLC